MSESGAQKFLRSIEGTLEIPQAQAAPGWTSEKPTVPGWYWYKNEYRTPVLSPIVRQVTHQDLRLNHWPTHGEWSGPLTPPEGDAHG